MKKINRNKKIALFINVFLLVLFITLIIYLTVRYTSSVTRIISNPEEFSQLLSSYGYTGVLVFIFFQFLQVVIAAIPGEVVQVAGGYIYGTLLGSLYSIIGITLGYVAVFFVSRVLGYSLVKVFVPQKKIEQFSFLINSKKSEIAMFVLFLIPGLPKDVLVYIAGLTPVRPLRFLTLAMVARLPALIGSSFIGANLQGKNYVMAIIVSVVAVILFVAGLLFRDKIISKIKDII